MWHQLRSTRVCARSTRMMMIIIRDVILSIKTNLRIRLDDIININIIIIIITSILRSEREIRTLQWTIEILFSVSLPRSSGSQLASEWVSESVTWDVRDKCSLSERSIRVCSVDATGIQSFSHVASLQNCSIDLRCESLKKQNLGTNEFTLFSAELFDGDECVRFHLSSVTGTTTRKHRDRTWRRSNQFAILSSLSVGDNSLLSFFSFRKSYWKS